MKPEKLKNLQDVWNYMQKHKWFIGDCKTQKGTLEYYQRVFNKIYDDLNLLYDKGILK